MSDIKACIDCRHFSGQEADVYYPHPDPHGLGRQSNRGPECKHASAVTRDLVFGKCFCANERNNNRGCGKKGKLWEPKTDAK